MKSSYPLRMLEQVESWIAENPNGLNGHKINEHGHKVVSFTVDSLIHNYLIAALQDLREQNKLEKESQPKVESTLDVLSFL